MAYLHNRISNQELKQRLMEEKEKRITISFYNYFPIAEPQSFRDALFLQFDALKVFGRIYIASEGINAQISVPERNYQDLCDLLHAIPGLEDLRMNIAVDDDGKSFWVLRMKVRDKIVADGIDDPTFSMERRGKYVRAEEFNELAENEATIIIDMRNHYEYEVGHFEKAVELPSDTFREQLPMAVEMLADKKDTPIIMYCTGGIRCEKASAYMLHHGFNNVFHLEGGIIHYTNQTKEKGLPNKFLGKNFVFDNRLGERISDTVIAHCHQCGKPADTHTNCVNPGCHLLFIQCAACAEKYQGCCSIACMETIALPEEEQKEKRKHVDKGQNIYFNKSRRRMESLRKPD
ncbi:MAG: rhodanese-related sulfurtransferase [Chitinophagales bacterium]